jgi:hypothetical protein
MSESQKDMESPAPRRRTYNAPKLRSYGNIRDITRDVGNKGAHDSFPPTKPHGTKRTSI